MIWLIIDEYKEKQIPKNPSENISNTQNIQKDTKQKTYPKEKVVSKYKGYDVIANLKIPKIKLETNIFRRSNESMCHKIRRTKSKYKW